MIRQLSYGIRRSILCWTSAGDVGLPPRKRGRPVVTQNWRGKPLVSLQTIVQLIAATTTATGLKVRCAIDRKTYPAGVKVTDREMDAIDILRRSFHGEWNYTIRPKTPVSKR